MMTDQQIIEKYGQPGDPDNLTTLVLPYPMRIAWDLSKSVTKMQCHKLIHHRLNNVFIELLNNYGYDELKRLGIDIFAGCYNFRLKRGSKTEYSRHSWAIAFDLDPDRNGLKTNWIHSQFSKPEYKKLLDITYHYDFINYGKEKNYDSMHFEINS